MLDGLAELDTRYAMETDDGALIEIVNYGYRHGPAAVIERLAAVFKPIAAASRSRRVPKGRNQVPKRIADAEFRDGIEAIETNCNAAA